MKKEGNLGLKRAFLFSLVAILLLAGCFSTRSPISPGEGTLLGRYKVFEIVPVKNMSGRDFDFDIGGGLVENLTGRLRSKGYTVVDETVPEGDVLVIKSVVTTYEPGFAFFNWVYPGAGATRMTVKTLLLDRNSQLPVAELVNGFTFHAGFVLSVMSGKIILGNIASSIADDMDRMIKEARAQAAP
jgi:hypothetical protein